MTKKGAPKPSAAGSKSKTGKTTAPKVIWSKQNVKALVRFLAKNKSTAGDGASFKMATFRAAAVHLAGKKYTGPEKSADACKNKWGRVRAFFSSLRPCDTHLVLNRSKRSFGLFKS